MPEKLLAIHDKIDALYVVSDLHLGQSRNGTLFNQYKELATLAKELANQSADRAIALCLNGDIVDFLLGSDAKYVNTKTAIATLDRIADGESPFSVVFEGLRAFTAKPRALLLLNLGNHDLELAQPQVRAHFVSLITGGAKARDRVRWSTTGFSVEVQDEKVGVVHGNAADPWNKLDPEVVTAVANSAVDDEPLGATTPNGGTQLVIDVLNKIKERYAFIDLLKPETDAVPPVLFALPGGAEIAKPLIGKAAGAFGVSIRNRLKKLIGILSTDDPRTRSLRRDDSVASVVRDRDLSKDDIRAAVDIALEQQLAVESMLPQGNATLGWFDYFVARSNNHSPKDALRAALREYASGQAFAFDELSSDDESIDRRESKDFTVLIAGHTHLARFAPRVQQRGHYINTGTWIRLIRITERLLSDGTFPKLYERLQTSKVAELDAEIDGVPVIYQENSVAFVGPKQSHGAHGTVALLSFSVDAKGSKAAWTVRNSNLSARS